MNLASVQANRQRLQVVGATNSPGASGSGPWLATCNYPTGTKPGDLLLCFQQGDTGVAMTTPAGWTNLVATYTETGGVFQARVEWRVAGTETSVQISTALLEYCCVIALRQPGSSVALLGASGTFADSVVNGGTLNVPALTAQDAWSTVVLWASDRSNSAPPLPAGFTSWLSGIQGGVFGFLVATKEFNAAGTTGTVGVTHGSTTQPMVAIIIEVKP